MKNDEKVIGIFPEGTTEKEKGIMIPFKIGAFKMANDTNTEIIPFAITGNYTLFSKTLTIRFGTPISVGNDLEQEKNKFEQTIYGFMRGDS